MDIIIDAVSSSLILFRQSSRAYSRFISKTPLHVCNNRKLAVLRRIGVQLDETIARDGMLFELIVSDPIFRHSFNINQRFGKK